MSSHRARCGTGLASVFLEKVAAWLRRHPPATDLFMVMLVVKVSTLEALC